MGYDDVSTNGDRFSLKTKSQNTLDNWEVDDSVFQLMSGKLKSPMINNELYLLTRSFNKLKNSSHMLLNIRLGGMYTRQIISGLLVPICTVTVSTLDMEVDDNN